MTLQTRKPTGLPSWPITLLAGVEKSGKTYAAAEASGCDLIGRTLWFAVGEDAPDEYGAIPGARFEIVDHDGTYRDLLAKLTEAATLPAKRKPNLIVIDSGTRLWDLLCDEQQHVANERARRKAERYKRPVPDEDATITMDQWNTAKQRWGHILDTLRDHKGPSIVTSRLEEITVVNDQGEPTKDRRWKVKAEKSLPFDAGAIVEMYALGDTWLTGVRSLRFKPGENGRVEYKPFTVDRLWRDLGLAEKTGERHHIPNDPADKPASEADQARIELRQLCETKGWDLTAVAALYADRADGALLRDAANAKAIRSFAADLEENGLPGQDAAA